MGMVISGCQRQTLEREGADPMLSVVPKDSDNPASSMTTCPTCYSQAPLGTTIHLAESEPFLLSSSC